MHRSKKVGVWSLDVRQVVNRQKYAAFMDPKWRTNGMMVYWRQIGIRASTWVSPPQTPSHWKLGCSSMHSDWTNSPSLRESEERPNEEGERGLATWM